MNNKDFYNKYSDKIEAVLREYLESFETDEEKVDFFVEEFNLSDYFYLDNLTNKHSISEKAVEVLMDYLGIKNFDIDSIDKILKIKNLNDTGIVEFIAKDEFTIEDNEIITV